MAKQKWHFDDIEEVWYCDACEEYFDEKPKGKCPNCKEFDALQRAFTKAVKTTLTELSPFTYLTEDDLICALDDVLYSTQHISFPMRGVKFRKERK